MNVAMGQVGPPIRELWINIALSLRASGDSVYFFGPSPAFERLLHREGLRESVVVFDQDATVPVPSSDRRSDILDYNQTKLGYDRADLERRCYNFERMIDTYDIDVAVFWNDVDVEHIVADRDIETVYLENGYLSNTIQIDTDGVNRNASYADLTADEIADTTPIWAPIHDLNVSYRPIPSLSTPSKVVALLETRGNRGNFWWTIRDEVRKLTTAARRRLVRHQSRSIELPEEYVFVPLQVHDDTQVLYNSPYVEDMYDFVDFVVDSVADIMEDITIVVKEHPADIGRVNYDDLRRRHPDVVWLRDFPIETVVNDANVVVTLNSSVGMQALKRYVPVVTLGDSFYYRNPFVERPTTREEVPEAIDTSLAKCLDEDAVDEYISAFAETMFVPGSVQNFGEETIRKIGSAIRNVGGHSSSSRMSR